MAAEPSGPLKALSDTELNLLICAFDPIRAKLWEVGGSAGCPIIVLARPNAWQRSISQKRLLIVFKIDYV
jgi:hypothetical protein